MYKLRYTIGRMLIYLGLWTLPPGRVRTELTLLLEAWSIDVITKVSYAKIRGEI